MVAGRFWCSYAWVSLTPTAPVRPRAGVCRRVHVLLGGVYAVCTLCGVVWWRVGLWRCAVIPFFRLSSGGARVLRCASVVLGGVRGGGAGWVG